MGDTADSQTYAARGWTRVRGFFIVWWRSYEMADEPTLWMRLRTATLVWKIMGYGAYFVS